MRKGELGVPGIEVTADSGKQRQRQDWNAIW
jgi:hypothetical protein